MEHNNLLLAIVSGIFAVTGTASMKVYAFVSGDAPTWLFVIASIVVPLVTFFLGKAIDIYFTHYRKK